jgi:hypothetical protein
MSDPLTPEQQAALAELVSAYQVAKRAGKFVVAVFVGLLGLIVLFFQAWEAVSKFLHAKIGG